jgi:hypothetical protein
MNAQVSPDPSHARLPWLNRAALRHWTFHVCLSAAPSLVFGYSMATRPERFCGMSLGVAFFIVLYTLAARWTYPSETSSVLWRRAMRLGTWIRTVWVLLLIPAGLVARPFAGWLFAPDMVAGMISHGLVESLSGLNSGVTERTGTGSSGHFWLGDMGSLIPTFFTTVISGFLLSSLLLLIAFICLGVLKLMARRKVSS